MATVTFSATAGLSPRVRGNRCAGGSGILRAGSIPAGAGEPAERHRDRWRSGVYPRGCGGTVRYMQAPPSPAGLSPRVRGNPCKMFPAAESVGSIPAGAGEPARSTVGNVCVRVYPRGCGGTTRSAHLGVLVRGLSPRVRGNRHVPEHCPQRLGSIPAGAGEPPF